MPKLACSWARRRSASACSGTPPRPSPPWASANDFAGVALRGAWRGPAATSRGSASWRRSSTRKRLEILLSPLREAGRPDCGSGEPDLARTVAPWAPLPVMIIGRAPRRSSRAARSTSAGSGSSFRSGIARQSGVALPRAAMMSQGISIATGPGLPLSNAVRDPDEPVHDIVEIPRRLAQSGYACG